MWSYLLLLKNKLLICKKHKRDFLKKKKMELPVFANELFIYIYIYLFIYIIIVMGGPA